MILQTDIKYITKTTGYAVAVPDQECETEGLDNSQWKQSYPLHVGDLMWWWDYVFKSKTLGNVYSGKCTRIAFKETFFFQIIFPFELFDFIVVQTYVMY